MSITVSATELASFLDEYGSACFLTTVDTSTTSAKVIHVPVRWDCQVIRCTPGGGTLKNLGDGAPVTLIFPAPSPGSHSMLIDGFGRDSGHSVAEIDFLSGVLHRPAPGDVGEQSQC